MGDIKIQDLVQSMRDSAGAKSAGDSGDAISRAEANLAIAERAKNQLPPLTTYRHGLSSRIELWVKRLVKRLTHWFTWEQVNFNAAVNHSLNDTLSALRKLERQLSAMRVDLDDTARFADLESRLAALESRFASIDDRITATPGGEVDQERTVQQETFDLILSEQRVCFKQLSLEISETRKVVARTERNLQTRMDELARRLEEVSLQPKAKAVGSSDAADRHDQQGSLV